jgi:hypothetical protein
MTEEQWQACDDPMWMLNFAGSLAGLRNRPRKWWLFSTACGQQNRQKLPSPQYRRLLAVLERYADGLASRREVQAVLRDAGYPRDPLDSSPLGHDPVIFAWNEAYDIATRGDRNSLLCQLLRDLFNNPFRPVVLDPEWQSPTVVSLAAAAYEHRLLPSGHLDPARLLVLGDALEDAGCPLDHELLLHLREGKRTHIRGCFGVDLLLGKS